MSIEGLTDYQKLIADILWSVQTKAEVQKVINALGVDALIVYNMILAQMLDEYEGTVLAENYLQKFML